VIAYDVRAYMQALARKNLALVGLSDYVTFKLHDIAQGFEERDADALFLDLPNPWDYVAQAHAALKSGGFFGALVPTANQVIALLSALEAQPFIAVEVEELILRPYKPASTRLRPVDRIVGHTGYLIFARTLLPGAREPGMKPEASEMEANNHEDEEEEARGWGAVGAVRYGGPCLARPQQAASGARGAPGRCCSRPMRSWRAANRARLRRFMTNWRRWPRPALCPGGPRCSTSRRHAPGWRRAMDRQRWTAPDAASARSSRWARARAWPGCCRR